MSSTRPYRSAIPMATVVSYIRSRSGHHFDPLVVDAFLRVVEEEGLLRTPEPLRA